MKQGAQNQRRTRLKRWMKVSVLVLGLSLIALGGRAFAQAPAPTDPGIVPLPGGQPAPQPALPQRPAAPPPANAIGLVPLPALPSPASPSSSRNVAASTPAAPSAPSIPQTSFRLISSDTPISPSEPVILRSTTDLRLREQPNTQGRGLSVLPLGQRVELLAMNPTGTWYEVDFDGLIGWASAQWLMVDSGNLPPVFRAESGQYLVATDDVNLRVNPGSTYGIIGGLPRGENVRLLGVNADTTWYQVDYDGLIAWGAAQFLNFDEAYSAERAAAQTLMGVSVQTRPNVSSAPLLAEPNAASSLLGMLRRGAEAEIMQVDADGEWYEVSANGLQGWVNADLVELVESEEIEEAEETEEAAEAESVESVGWADAYQRLESGELDAPSNLTTAGDMLVLLLPDYNLNAPPIAVLLRGATVHILNVDPSGLWLEIDYNGLRGWVMRGSLAPVR